MDLLLADGGGSEGCCVDFGTSGQIESFKLGFAFEIWLQDYVF